MSKIDIPQAQDSTHRGVLIEQESDNADPTDVLRLYVAALTGLDKTKVRRRWQPEPGMQPKVTEDWCAIGFTQVTTPGTPYQKGYKPNQNDPQDTITRTSYQTLKCVATFYGSNAFSLADTFREGIQLPQNNDVIKRYGLTVQGVADDILRLSELVNNQWVNRFDVVFNVGRSVTRTFGVRSISGTDIGFLTDERGKL